MVRPLVLRCLLASWLALFTLAGQNLTRAHTPGLSTLVVRIEPDRLDAELVFSIGDAGEIVNLDKDGDGKLSKEEITSGVLELQALANQALEVKVDGTPVQPSKAACRFDEYDNATVNLGFPATNFSNLLMCSSWLVFLQPGHRETFSLQNDKGETLTERILNVNDSCVAIQLDTTSKQQTAQEVAARRQTPAPKKHHAQLAWLPLAVVVVAGGAWLVTRRK